MIPIRGLRYFCSNFFEKLLLSSPESQLKQQLPITNDVGGLAFINTGISYTTSVTIAGWGFPSFAQAAMSEELKTVLVIFTRKNECPSGDLEDHEYCASDAYTPHMEGASIVRVFRYIH